MANAPTTRLINNIFHNYFKFAFSLVVNIFLAKIILVRLGANHYGLWVVAGSVLSYLSLMEFGFNPAIINALSKTLADSDGEATGNIISTAFWLLLLIGIACLGISAAVSRAGGLLKVLPENIAVFEALILIVGASLFVSLAGRVNVAIINAHERFNATNYIEIGNNLSKITLVFLFLGDSVLTLAWIYLLLNVGINLGYLIYAFHLEPHFTIRPSRFRKRYLGEMFRYSVWAFVLSIADKLRFYTDAFVIALLFNTESVTVYFFGTRLVEYARHIIGPISGPFLPYLSKSAHGPATEADQAGRLFLATKLIACISFSVMWVIVGTGREFLSLWIGRELGSIGVCYGILLILILPSSIDMAQSATVVYAYATAKHRYLSIVTLLEGIANLVLSIVLGRWFGLLGIAFATAIPMAVNKLLLQPIYVCRMLNVSSEQYFYQCLLKPFMPSLLILVVFAVLKRALDLSQFFSVALLSAALFFATVLPYALFVLDLDERAALLRPFQNWRRQ